MSIHASGQIHADGQATQLCMSQAAVKSMQTRVIRFIFFISHFEQHQRVQYIPQISQHVEVPFFVLQSKTTSSADARERCGLPSICHPEIASVTSLLLFDEWKYKQWMITTVT
jgi:hypothetical protein